MPGRLQKHGPPKHLEKMLFINHKEDQLLDIRLHQLNMESRLKLMELDRERIKVRNEWRNSRKKQITINEAISSGLMPSQDDSVFYSGSPPKATQKNVTYAQNGDSTGSHMTSAGPPTNAFNFARRASAPAQAQRQDGSAKKPGLSRSSSYVERSNGNNKPSLQNQFSRPAAIPEYEEIEVSKMERIEFDSTRNSADTVGTYVLGEFEKISQVVPDILRALAKKKERQQELDERTRLKELQNDVVVEMENIMEYEPDMNKVRKTVRGIKKLRHRMAISKKLETPKHHKPLEQMIREKTERIGENDEYTDGTCALMKRRLEKKRRESSPFVLEPGFMSRRQSLSPDMAVSRRASVAPEGTLQRASSLSQMPSAMTRATTLLSVGSVGRLTAIGADPDGDESPFVDEDVLMNRQRIMREIDKYRLLLNRVDRFVLNTAACGVNRIHVLEEITPLS